MPSDAQQEADLKQLSQGGESVKLKVQYTDASGASRGVTIDYNIRGPGFNFASVDLAALDAISASWWLHNKYQDNLERGGDLRVRNVDGAEVFFYNDIQTGSPGQADRRGSRMSTESAVDFVISGNAVAVWHIHPPGGSAIKVLNQAYTDSRLNENFSSGDIERSKAYADPTTKGAKRYFEANDRAPPSRTVRLPEYLGNNVGEIIYNPNLWDSGARGSITINPVFNQSTTQRPSTSYTMGKFDALLSGN